MMKASSPAPLSFSTLKPISCASGAMPRYSLPATPPAMMAATWVPCPLPSSVSNAACPGLCSTGAPRWVQSHCSSTVFLPSARRKCGWRAAMPVSSTAHVMPLPFAP